MEGKKRIKSKELIWDCSYSPSQGGLIYLIRKRSKCQTRGTGMSWIGPKRQPASFCCRQVQTRNSGGSNSRWSQPGSLVWHQSEPDWRPPPSPFATKSTHNALLYLVLAPRFISQRSQVFLAAPARRCSQREIHCSPSAKEGHAELLLLSRHQSPECCFFFLVPVLIIWEPLVFNGKIWRQLFLFKFYMQNATAAKRSSNWSAQILFMSAFQLCVVAVEGRSSGWFCSCL